MTNSVHEIDNLKLVLRFIEALNDEGKSTAVLDRFSTSEVLARKVMNYREEYPDFRIRPLDVFSERNLVVLRFDIDFDAGSFAGQDQDAATPELLEAIAVFGIDDGLIRDLWLELDVVGQVLAAVGAPPEPAGDARRDPLADTEVSRAVILRYIAALNNQRKTSSLIKGFATDRALVEHVLAFEESFPGYTLIADDVIADHDRVAVRFHTRQHHANEFMGIGPTHQDLSITGLIIYRIEAGKIAEHWLQADLWALMTALQDGELMPSKQHLIDRRVRGERRQTARVPAT